MAGRQLSGLDKFDHLLGMLCWVLLRYHWTFSPIELLHRKISTIGIIDIVHCMPRRVILRHHWTCCCHWKMHNRSLFSRISNSLRA